MDLSNSEFLEEEPSHSYTKEVRDLFGVSLVTDLLVEHDDCDFLNSKGEEPCSCPAAPQYYLGRRPDPEMGGRIFVVAGPCTSLSELEAQCERRIDYFRKEAGKNASAR
jgi:hypothetical protein